MGLFNFGSKEAIKTSAYKISVGLKQIEQELEKNNQQVTPMAKGIAWSLRDEAKNIEKYLKPNGRTDWDLYNSINVKIHSGETIDFCTFEARVNNMSQFLEEKGVVSFRIWT